MHNQTIEQILAMMDTADQRQDDLATYQHRMIRLRVGYTAVVLVGYAGILVYAVTLLWSTWHTGARSPFWDTMRFVWGAVALVGAGTEFYERGRQAGQAHVLRAQINAQTRRRELPEAEQPQALAPSEMSAGGERFGPFERLERGRTLDMVSALTLSVPIAAVLGLGLILALLFAHVPTLVDVAFVVLLLGLPEACLLGLTVLAIRRLRRIRRPLTVFADGWGLRWETATASRQQAHLPWYEVRSFFVIAEPGAGDNAYSVYVVQGNDARLAGRCRACPRQSSARQTNGSAALSPRVRACP